MKNYISLLILLGVICSCVSPDHEAYHRELAAWKSARLERLKSPSGYLNLAGLYWLQEGKNTIGSDSSNSIIFPASSLPFFGTVILKNDSLRFTPAGEGTILINEKAVGETMMLDSDKSGNPDICRSGSHQWHIIKRGDKYGIRLRDLDHPRLDQLEHIESFEPRLKWRIKGSFTAFENPMEVLVPNVLGEEEAYEAPGVIEFRKGLKKYQILPFTSRNGFFIILGDKTSGDETYAAGRFMYTSLPDEKGELFLDFNKAYNPPCAFSPYATCPLPPPENRLKLEIRAGEKAVHLD